MATTYRSIARIQKTHGRKGEVVAVPAHGLPPLLHANLEVFLVPPSLKGPRCHVVRGCVGTGDAQLVSFGGVDSLDAASKLVGRTVLARVSDLPADALLHDVDAWLGRTVRDASHGELGRIEEVLRGPAQDVWVVRGALGEVLIPVVEEFVRELPENGSLVVKLPRGLVAAAREDQVPAYGSSETSCDSFASKGDCA